MREHAEKQKSDWVKVGPCLYRYKGGAYYALFKVDGKQIRRSHVETWIAAYKGKAASTVNDYIATARALFEQAVNDGELAGSPILGAKYWKRGKPLRLTPTYEQFQAIMDDLRDPARHNPHGQAEI